MAFPGPHHMGGSPNFLTQPQVYSSRPSPLSLALPGNNQHHLTDTISGSSSYTSSSSSHIPSSSSSNYHQQQQRQPPFGAAHHPSSSKTDALPHQPLMDGQFDIFEWHTQFQSCVRYFLDHAQHSGPVQAVAAFLNIQLPFQKQSYPLYGNASGAGTPPGAGGPHGGMHSPQGGAPSLRSAGKMPMHMGGQQQHQQQQQISYATVTPYVRRLVATGFDIPGVLHGFFGDDWVAGIGPLHEAERRNYLFAAKSDSWLRVKTSYDEGDGQTVPFLKPLQGVSEKEIVGAESSWSEWLAMQDWMLGPRAPPDEGEDAGGGGGGVGPASGRGHSPAEVRVKTEVQSQGIYDHPSIDDDDDMDGYEPSGISASNPFGSNPRVRTVPRSRKRRHRPGASIDDDAIRLFQHHSQQRHQQDEAAPAARVAELRWDMAPSSARSRKGKAVRLG